MAICKAFFSGPISSFSSNKLTESSINFVLFFYKQHSSAEYIIYTSVLLLVVGLSVLVIIMLNFLTIHQNLRTPNNVMPNI